MLGGSNTWRLEYSMALLAHVLLVVAFGSQKLPLFIDSLMKHIPVALSVYCQTLKNS